MPAVTFSPGDGKEVGGYGPLEIVFSQPMQTASVESRLVITPAMRGRFIWQAQTLHFFPEGNLPPGTIYQVSLQPGATSSQSC
jgi:hypothetical protein